MEPQSAVGMRDDDGSQDAGNCFECDTPEPARTEWRVHAFTCGLKSAAAELMVRLPVRVCGSCGFEFLDHEAETLKHEAVCAHLGVLSPREVRGIRAMHGMSRAEFSKTTGLGEATLNRWENGILIQNQANDRYLRLLASPANMQSLLKTAVVPRTGAPRFLALDESAERRGRAAAEFFRLVPVAA